jgi:hypothetical protein
MTSRPLFLRRYYDWDRIRHLAFVVVLLIFVQALCGFAFWLGSEWTVDRARAEAAKIVTAKRANPAVNPPASLIDCTKEGRAEMLRICGARWRMGKL